MIVMETRRRKPSEIERLVERAQLASGLSKKALARRAGISPETLSRIGRRGTADFATVVKVMRAAGVDLLFQATAGDPSPSGRGHARLDERSLVLHALCAGKVLANPALIESRILPTIRRFRAVHAGTGTVRLLEAWERAARAGVRDLLHLCTAPTEEARQLRQASPMTGLLRPSERRTVYEAFAA